MKKCKECGDKAQFICIDNGDWYCNNCMKILNVNNMGETDLYYHFLYKADVNSKSSIKEFEKAKI